MFKFSIQIKWTIVIIIYHVNEKVDLWNPRWVEVGLSGKHYLALHLQGKNLKEKEHEKKKEKQVAFFNELWVSCSDIRKKKQRKSVDVKKSFSLTFWSFLVSSFGWNKILLFSTLSGYIIKCCAGEGWTEKYLALIQDTQALLHFVHRLCPQAKYLPGA